MNDLERSLASCQPWPSKDHHNAQATNELAQALRLSGKTVDGLRPRVLQLLKDGANPDGPDRDGAPLRRAIELKSTFVVEDLLEHGANPNARLLSLHADLAEPLKTLAQNNVDTVLHWAIYRACLSSSNWPNRAPIAIVLNLIATGADRAATSQFGMSCLELAERESNGARAIPDAISTPLHAAVKINDIHLCLKMLELGFDPDEKNSRNQTAWRIAELHAKECLAAMHAWRSRAVVAKFSPIHEHGLAQ